MIARMLAGTAAAIGLAGTAHAAPDCGKLTAYRDAAIGLVVTTAQRVPAAPAGTVRPNPQSPPIAVPLPAYCRVTGVIAARTGTDGKSYGLRFELRLPDDWGGRFLFQGGGGLNGTVNAPLGAAAAGEAPALARGFAVVSTDSGHQGAVFDASFMADQRASLDFSHASVGTVAPAAKRIVAAYYGRPPAHSYMIGCSTGGRESMLAAERYPEMFDGIVIGAPAMRTGYSNLALDHAGVAFNRAAPRDAAGLPQAERLFSAEDRALIVRGILDACDALDGLKDGVVGNPMACRFRPVALECAGAKAATCLSHPQVEALEEAFATPRDAAGRPLYAAFPYDPGIAFEGPGLPGFLVNAGRSPLGPRTTALTFDADAAADRVRADASQALTDTNRWTNLGAFLGHGGKIIFYHGMGDPWFSALDTMDYYKRAEAANGAERWAASSRFYPVPGMGHCGGGANTYDRFDLLGPVVDWVEHGRAPGVVVASRTTPAPGSRPLCPLPGHPHYGGSGDQTVAASFACRAD